MKDDPRNTISLTLSNITYSENGLDIQLEPAVYKVNAKTPSPFNRKQTKV